MISVPFGLINNVSDKFLIATKKERFCIVTGITVSPKELKIELCIDLKIFLLFRQNNYVEA